MVEHGLVSWTILWMVKKWGQHEYVVPVNRDGYSEEHKI